MRGKQDHGKERALRRQQTDAEQWIWQCVRNRRLHGFKFRRKHQIGQVFVDFVCLEVKLIIELDGSDHPEPRQSQTGTLRTAYLKEMGYRVLRFQDNEALCDTAIVLDEIARELYAPRPAPNFRPPPPRGLGKHGRGRSNDL